MAYPTKRSLIRFGKGIAITLPKAWTDYHHLKPGDKIRVRVGSSIIAIYGIKEKDSAESLAAPAESTNQSTNGGDSNHGS